ncbi:MAG: DUF1801 domain-containing protein [Anaerolineales bacterium]|uniref:DUF1801 domain-containing protein n=1 Tax=Candidatus Desulfolinea nitratireducens TaxID=2841698 RepID=A0A8J6NJD5_9CHLR|nr:DUF1801 domain-containing protein [Candidatus Desulfolinea nitratireducens]MBL6960513.1 DUF1801 domain-containing protein [Anaerolineales bacterium]
MVQSKSKTVDAYLNEVPAERKAGLSKLRELCLSSLKGFQEGMAYGMPSYSRNGEVEVAFASQKNYISLYILKQVVMNAHKEKLAGQGISFGKGCIRYTRTERMDFELVENMLRDAERSDGEIC